MKLFNTACLTLVALLVKAAIAVPVPPQPGRAPLAVHVQHELGGASVVATVPLVLETRETEERTKVSHASAAAQHRSAIQYWNMNPDAYSQGKVAEHQLKIEHHEKHAIDPLGEYGSLTASRYAALQSLKEAKESIEEFKTPMEDQAKKAHKLAGGLHSNAGGHFWRNHVNAYTNLHGHTDPYAQGWVDHHKKWTEHHDKNAENPLNDYATLTDSRNAAHASIKDAKLSIENAKSYSSTRVDFFHAAMGTLHQQRPDGHKHH